MSSLSYPKEIIDSKFENNKCYYLVQWKNCNTPTWEPDHHISHRTDLISEYRDMLIIEQLSMQSGGYIYCRVSSKEQSKYNEGHTSLQVQEKEIREYCEDNNINVLKVVHEVYSARNMDKLKGLNYLCDIVSPGQKIFVYDISRFSRNAHHALNLLEDLIERNISVVSVTENISYGNAASRNQFRLQLCASTYYSDLCSQKVKASIAYRKARGDYMGGTPFGYTTKLSGENNLRTKIVCEEEMKVVELIRKHKSKDLYYILNNLKTKNIMFRKREPTISGISRIIGRFDTDLKPTRKRKRVYRKRSNNPY